MAIFLLGLLVGFGLGVAVARRFAPDRGPAGATSAAPSVVAPRAPAAPATAAVAGADEGTPVVTKKAAKVGIRPEDLVPKDDILQRMQRAWERGVSLEELDALEAEEAAAAEAGGAAAPAVADSAPPTPVAGPLVEPPATIAEAQEVLAGDGYGEALALAGGELACEACGTSHPPDLVEPDRVYRYGEGPEGAEGDTILLGLRCPACGARGAVVVGPDAEPAVADAAALLARKAGHG